VIGALLALCVVVVGATTIITRAKASFQARAFARGPFLSTQHPDGLRCLGSCRSSISAPHRLSQAIDAARSVSILMGFILAVLLVFAILVGAGCSCAAGATGTSG